MEVAGEGGRVAFLGVGKVADGDFGEVEAEHGTDPVEGQRLTLDRGADRFLHLCAKRLKECPSVDALHLLELGETRREGEGIPREGSCLIDGAERGEMIHDLGAASECPDGEASSDDLSQGGEVGSNSVNFLSASGGKAESGHDLVEDEQGAMLATELLDRLQIAWLRQVKACIGRDGLEDDAGDFGALFPKESLKCLQIIEGNRRGESGK